MCTKNNKVQATNNFELLHGNFSWKCTRQYLQIDLSCKASQQKNATRMYCKVSVQKENNSLTRRSGNFLMLVCLFVSLIASEVRLHSAYITIEGHFNFWPLVWFTINCTISRLYYIYWEDHVLFSRVHFITEDETMWQGALATVYSAVVLCFSKIQLVVYYQCCVLIGWATSRLFVIAH